MTPSVNHIFDSMWKHEYALRDIRRFLRVQSKFNRKIEALEFLFSVYVVISEINKSRQNAKIKKLRDELEELKAEKET